MHSAGPSISKSSRSVNIATTTISPYYHPHCTHEIGSAKFPYAVKCSFCRKIYERAGAYKTHLRRPHANLDIVHASTIQNPPAYILADWGTDESDANKPIEHGASAHASDPAGDTASSEAEAPDDTVRREPETEVLKDNTYPVAAEQQDELGAHEAIGDVKEYNEECRDLCENPWALFASAQGFKLDFSCIESKISKTRINNYFSNDIGNSTSVGCSSMHILENLLRHLDPYSPYLQWLEGHVEDGQRTLLFFYRNRLDCVKYLLRLMLYCDDLVHAPRREYDQSGQRIYAERHTADWWWDIQVLPCCLYYLKAY